MDISKYKNIIDEYYSKLSKNEKEDLINSLAVDIFSDLGIPKKYYPKITLSKEKKYNEYHPSALLSNPPSIKNFFKQNDKTILLSSSVFLDCEYSEDNSIARMLCNALYHEGVHCLQELVREGKVELKDEFNFTATIEDLKAVNNQRKILTIEHDTGAITKGWGLSYIVGVSDVIGKEDRQTFYFTQPNEWDASNIAYHKTMQLLQEFCKCFSQTKGYNLTNIKKSIHSNMDFFEDKQIFIDRQVFGFGYETLDEFRKDQAILCRTLFLEDKPNLVEIERIKNEHPAFYNSYLKASMESYQERCGHRLFDAINNENEQHLFDNSSNNKIYQTNNINLISNSSALENAKNLAMIEQILQQLGKPPNDEQEIDFRDESNLEAILDNDEIEIE